MSNPDPTPPRRGRSPVHRHPGQGSSSSSSVRGGSPVPPSTQEPPPPSPAGPGIASEIPHGVQPGVGGGGSGTVDPSVGGGGPTVVFQIGGGVVERKRAREWDAGAGPSRWVRPGLLPPPLIPPVPLPLPPVGAVEEQGQGMFYCSTCVRYFDSDRGLCGHLRTHADRGYRGAFPPPVFTRQEFVDEVVEHLLNPLDGGGEVDPTAAAGGGGGGGAHYAGQNAEAAQAEASGGAAARRDIDLNVPAPREDNGDFI